MIYLCVVKLTGAERVKVAWIYLCDVMRTGTERVKVAKRSTFVV
jgi:hypothetical protein